MTAPPRHRELEDEIERVRTDKENAIESQEFEKAASLRDKERKLTQKKKELEENWRTEESEEQPVVGEDEIADIVSMWTGIPVFKLTEAESQKLIRMEDEAAQARHRPAPGDRRGLEGDPARTRGIEDRSGRPARSSSSAVRRRQDRAGAHAGEFLFGDEDAMIQVDMSEYMEKHSCPGSSALRPATSATTRAAS